LKVALSLYHRIENLIKWDGMNGYGAEEEYKVRIKEIVKTETFTIEDQEQE
jgi:hypothetical protein